MGQCQVNPVYIGHPSHRRHRFNQISILLFFRID